MKHPIYCHFTFFEAFIEHLKGKEIIEYLSSGNDFGKNLYKLLIRESKLELNLTDEDIIKIAKTNPYINQLLKNQSIKSKFVDFTNFLPNGFNPNTLFLLDLPYWETEKLKDKYGFWFFCKDRMNETKDLFKFQNYNFTSRKPFTDFGFFYKYKHPCNALVLTDDYLFSDAGRYDALAITNTLIPLLRNILPSKLDTDFHITILSVPNDISLDYETIGNQIKSATESYKYEIKVNFIKKNFHERHLFTNYYKITADKGFKKKSSKNSFELRCIFSSISKDQDYIEKNRRV